jgi:hypothetical protein
MASMTTSNVTALSLHQPNLDSIVWEIRQLYVGAGIGLAVDMGRLIIERLFGGDLHRWRSRGRKDVSFRKLEKHPALPFRASTLSRAVAIYMLSKRRGDLTAFEHVSTSHLHEIAGLEDGEQDQLLAKVESEKWSMRRLRREVAVLKVGRARRRNRGCTLAPWLHRILDDMEQHGLSSDLHVVDQLGIDPSLELLDMTRSALRQFERLARALGQRIQELDRRGQIPSMAR